MQLLYAGTYAEARALGGRTLQQALDALGPRHPRTLLVIASFASALDARGAYEEALKFFELGLKTNSEVYVEERQVAIVLFKQRRHLIIAKIELDGSTFHLVLPMTVDRGGAAVALCMAAEAISQSAYLFATNSGVPRQSRL